MLAEDLAAWPEDAWLVTDDYQFTTRSPVADSFLDSVTRRAPLQVLITSRQRPAWATARRLLYGEIYELGQNALAMNHDEAALVLAKPAGETASGLVALAQGWPAVIGLAALSGDVPLPDGDMPSALYDYFADELYQAASAPVQRSLCQLAIAPVIDLDLARSLLGAQADAVISRAVQLGFLARGTFDLHPLLRSFLLKKVQGEGNAVLRSLVDEVGSLLLREQRWDDVYTLAERFRDKVLLGRLLESAFDQMLKDSRLATLARWSEDARDWKLDLPSVDLVEAELALRRGAYAQAESLALEATRELPYHHSLASRSFEVAGRAAHLSDREEIALQYHAEAEKLAKRPSEVRNALWGQVLSAHQVEHADIGNLVKKLKQLGHDIPDDRLRLAHARFLLAYHDHRLSPGTTAMRSASHVVAKVDDPIVRTSFFNAFARALVLEGFYKEADPWVERILREAHHHRLEFVLPHAYTTKAVVELGLRRFASALSFARRAERTAKGRDIHNLVEAKTIQCKIHICQGAFSAALEVAQLTTDERPNAGVYSELIAYRGLAAILNGSRKDGSDALDVAAKMSRILDTRAAIVCARAVRDVRDRAPSADRISCDAFNFVLLSGHADSFVTAYRGYPDFLSTVVRSSPDADRIPPILDRASDHELGYKVGLSLPTIERPTNEDLSPREREVHALLARGLKNKEIAQALFISEATVKVHIRKIFAKLGVRSRTEAALRAFTEPPQ
jgi:ATP/maltotriose-dependent transcriptional regulator MalT